MTRRSIAGTTEITSASVKKRFKTTDPWSALAELAWNGFDARATTVSITIGLNPMGAWSVASVLDDGDGIELDSHEETFGKFDDSSKKEDVSTHGSQGRGRLAFHRLAERAIWWTIAKDSGPARIAVDSSTLTKYEGESVDLADLPTKLASQGKGTCVELVNLAKSLPTVGQITSYMSVEFGWFLAMHPAKSLKLNGEYVPVPPHELTEQTLSVGSETFSTAVLRWDVKPTSEKSYVYLLNSAGKTVGRKLSTFNHKGDFHTSICVSSSWADVFVATGGDLANPDANGFDSDVWRKLTRELNKITQQVYEEFLRKQCERELDALVADGIFPTYAGLPEDYKRWRFENTKNILRAIYTADPTALKSLKKSQKKIIVRLLDKLAISNENDAIFEVLNSVLDLDEASTKLFAGQLRSATLQNIVAAIEVLRRRHDVAQMLRSLMNDHYLETTETPDLQRVIESNTWLFGHGYETLGAEEDTFTTIAKRLRETVKGINEIALEDLDEDDHGEIEGALKQADLFLARKVPCTDSFGKRIYRCILVEIKRPSIALGYKHLQQLDSYAQILKRHAEFGSDAMHFELILIGRKLSDVETEITSRMNTHLSKGLPGLVSDDARMKRYVLNWYSLLDNFLLTNESMIQALQLKRDDYSSLSKATLLARLEHHPA